QYLHEKGFYQEFLFPFPKNTLRMQVGTKWLVRNIAYRTRLFQSLSQRGFPVTMAVDVSLWKGPFAAVGSHQKELHGLTNLALTNCGGLATAAPRGTGA